MHRTLLKIAILGIAVVNFGFSDASVMAGYQSPINIKPSNTLYDPTLPALQFNYSNNVVLDVHNTGSPDTEATIKAYVTSGAGSVTVNGIDYELLQFHFHAGAEHLIDGARGAMEIHFVHKSISNEVLVVGQIIQVGAFNADLDPIFSDLPAHHHDTRSVNNFNLQALLPNVLSSFRYEGSLTTSPYTEGVKWNVLTTTTTISQGQLDAYTALFPDGDFRDAQDFVGWVLTDLQGFSSVPEPSSIAILGLGLLGLVIKRRSERLL